jgi:RNA polymerase sigma factor (sigma-70 family)
LNRCARRIADGEPIRDIGTYAIGVARMLIREKGREQAREPRPLADAPEPRVLPPEPDDLEMRAECLRQCLTHLPIADREIILSYYRGEKGEKIRTRKQLTRQFGVPASTLRMRALRLREKLQLCTLNCLQHGPANSVDKFVGPRSTL